MDVQKMNAAVQMLQNNLGDALLATDIFTSGEGQSIAGINSNPEACALFNQITSYVQHALKGSGYAELGRYYLMHLVNKHLVIILPIEDYQWVMYVDGNKAQLGLLLNVVLPKIINAFKEAIS